MKQYGDRVEEKLSNKGRIARFISLQGTTSKAEISSGLNLSMPTTLQNVKLLIEDGIVEETGEYASTGGRKAKALSVRSGAGYGAGVDITNNHVTMVMVNGKKEMIAGKRSRMPYENSPRYYEELLKAVKAFMESQEIDQRKIAGVGFSLPGIVDREHCLLLRSHTLRVENVSFRSLGDSLGYPYGIENDANSAAFAELGRETENAVYLSLSNTVGGAICLGNHFYPGENFKSAEFGHMVIEKNGKICYCGKKGCMDAYCSALVLEEKAGCSLEEYFGRVRRREEDALRILEGYLEDLAVGVTNLRMIFDCSIVLGGYVGGYLEDFLPELSRKLTEHNNFDIDTSYLKGGKYKLNAAAYGAALKFIDSFLKKIII